MREHPAQSAGVVKASLGDDAASKIGSVSLVHVTLPSLLGADEHVRARDHRGSRRATRPAVGDFCYLIARANARGGQADSALIPWTRCGSGDGRRARLAVRDALVPARTGHRRGPLAVAPSRLARPCRGARHVRPPRPRARLPGSRASGATGECSRHADHRRLDRTRPRLPDARLCRRRSQGARRVRYWAARPARTSSPRGNVTPPVRNPWKSWSACRRVPAADGGGPACSGPRARRPACEATPPHPFPR